MYLLLGLFVCLFVCPFVCLYSCLSNRLQMNNLTILSKLVDSKSKEREPNSMYTHRQWIAFEAFLEHIC